MQMRPSILSLFIFLFSIVSAMPTQRRAVEIDINDPSLPASVKAICSTGQGVTTVLSSKVQPNGVTITTGMCTPSNSSDSNPAKLVTRQQCVTAQNNCVSRFGTLFQGNGWVGKCGAPCKSTCYPGSNGPDPNDCQFIFNSMYQEDPQLFTLDPDHFILLTRRSCGTGIQNQIAPSSLGCSRKMIYDYQDWAAIGGYLAWNCQAPQGARGGKCVGTSGLFQSNIPDYYVQVYQNV